MISTPDHDGDWVHTGHLGWQEEHSLLVRAIYRLLGVGHCGKPGWRTGYQPGEAPRGGADRG